MLRVGVEITELEPGNCLLAGLGRNQRLLEHFLTLVSDRVTRDKGGFRRVGFPTIQTIEHRRIDAIEVADTADVQAKSERIPGRYAGGRNVARYLEVADGSTEVPGLPLRGQRQHLQLGRGTRDLDPFRHDSVVHA